MDKINWCLNTKNGIEIVEPNENLAEAYIKKAEDSLRAALALKNNKDWEISSSYYTMYFGLYAILMEIGIKCGIHVCTIEFMKSYLKDYFLKEDMELITKSMKARIDTQYYSDRNLSESFYDEMVKEAPLFLIKCKEVLQKMNSAKINKIREEIGKLKF